MPKYNPSDNELGQTKEAVGRICLAAEECSLPEECISRCVKRHIPALFGRVCSAWTECCYNDPHNCGEVCRDIDLINGAAHLVQTKFKEWSQIKNPSMETNILILDDDKNIEDALYQVACELDFYASSKHPLVRKIKESFSTWLVDNSESFKRAVMSGKFLGAWMLTLGLECLRLALKSSQTLLTNVSAMTNRCVCLKTFFLVWQCLRLATLNSCSKP